jgi:hypothetical protein
VDGGDGGVWWGDWGEGGLVLRCGGPGGATVVLG